MVTEQINTGQEYIAIKRVISILITDHELIENSEHYHHCFTLRDAKTGLQFTDTIPVLQYQNKGCSNFMNDNCVFCKIANGEIPASVIYEDTDFMVILDKFPGAYGHTLIIPKRHSDNIFDLDAGDASKLYPLAKTVAAAVRDSLNSDGINILQNNGEAAGQSVIHFHMHIIPRFKNDSVRIKWTPKEAGNDELNKLSDLVKSKLQ